MTTPDRDVFQRRIILPPDLFRNLEARAQRDGFSSVQTWAVSTFQMLLDKPRCPCCDPQPPEPTEPPEGWVVARG